MTRPYYEMHRTSRHGFDIVVDRTYEDASIYDLFDDSCHNLKEMARKVNSGECEWFIVRARAMLRGITFGEYAIGGLYYDKDKIKDVITDGTAELCMHEAAKEAVERAADLLPIFDKIVKDHTWDGRLVVL